MVASACASSFLFLSERYRDTGDREEDEDELVGEKERREDGDELSWAVSFSSSPSLLS